MADTPVVDEATAELDDLRADVLNLTERVGALEDANLKLAEWVVNVEQRFDVVSSGFKAIAAIEATR
jgi:small-conductance mechanosensitive channel